MSKTKTAATRKAPKKAKPVKSSAKNTRVKAKANVRAGASAKGGMTLALSQRNERKLAKKAAELGFKTPAAYAQTIITQHLSA